MKKIPTIFKRDPQNMKNLLREINPICRWVFDGEGVATRKYDGTCCMINEDGYWKRREIKKGKPVPNGFILEEEDENTGKSFGWVPVEDSDKWHIEAYKHRLPYGTYELVGPKIQGNPEGYNSHELVSHECAEIIPGLPRDYDGLREWLLNCNIEGVVFHHSDGRMAKIKKRDFE